MSTITSREEEILANVLIPLLLQLNMQAISCWPSQSWLFHQSYSSAYVYTSVCFWSDVRGDVHVRGCGFHSPRFWLLPQRKAV